MDNQSSSESEPISFLVKTLIACPNSHGFSRPWEFFVHILFTTFHVDKSLRI